MAELLEAVSKRNAERVAHLMQKGPSAAEVLDAVAACIEDDNTEILSLLLANGVDPNLRIPGRGWTLLHLAAEHQSVKTLALLLERGADVHRVDASGCTPLHHAVDSEADGAYQAGERPEPVLTLLLLRAGADPNAEDAEGKTPTDVAREYGYGAAVEAMESVCT